MKKILLLIIASCVTTCGAMQKFPKKVLFNVVKNSVRNNSKWERLSEKWNDILLGTVVATYCGIVGKLSFDADKVDGNCGSIVGQPSEGRVVACCMSGLVEYVLFNEGVRCGLKSPILCYSFIVGVAPYTAGYYVGKRAREREKNVEQSKK